MVFTGRRLAALVGLLCLAIALFACGSGTEIGPREEAPMPEKTIQQVLTDHTDRLMSLPGVVGTAQGECSGQPCIRVFVAEKTEELLMQIPPVIEGYQVSVDEIGEIKALDEPD